MSYVTSVAQWDAKNISFLQKIWLIEEMHLKFDTSVGGVARSPGGHDQSLKRIRSDREIYSELVRDE